MRAAGFDRNWGELFNMKCRTVQKRLSEYIDGRLSEELTRSIGEHCSSCDACAKELAFLKACRTRMSSLPAKAAPAGFLESLNRRLDAPEPRSGIVQTLFSPARIKLPLEAAGLFAVAALVLVILVPDEARKSDFGTNAPEHVAVMKKADQNAPMADSAYRPSGTRRVLKKSSRDEKAFQTGVYVIVFNPRSASGPALAMNEARRDRGGAYDDREAADASISKAKVAAARQIPPAEQKKETTDRRADTGPSADIRSAIRRSGATILEEKCDAATGHCSSITLETRADAITTLMNELKRFGDVHAEKPAPKADAGRMRIRIRLSVE